MLAVLCDAAYAYSTEGGKRRGLRMRREIEQWFESGNTAYVFSFESICDALSLDASYIRRRVFRSGAGSPRTRRRPPPPPPEPPVSSAAGP